MTAGPTITAAVAAYNAERWVAETLDSILGQTRPPDDVVVVDDGSTDGTLAEIGRFDGRVRVVTQSNQGVSAALNRAFAEARGEFVALCGADDLWPARKLEWQAEQLLARPDIDIAFGHARMFGVIERDFARPPGTGLLDSRRLIRELYAENFIAAPSAVIRRSLHQRLGGFREDLAGEDYEFWLHALRSGATFYYDPRLMLHYRRHGDNLSMPGGSLGAVRLPMLEMNHRIHVEYSDLVSRGAARRALAKDLCDMGRHLVSAGDETRARSSLRASLRRRPGARALVWLGLLAVPHARREPLIDRFLQARHRAFQRGRDLFQTRFGPRQT